MLKACSTAPRYSLLIAAVVACGAPLLTGCGLTQKLQTQPTEYYAPFPAELEQTYVANIQVIRTDTIISYTNTTASTLPAGTLWVNQAFGMPVEALAPGETGSYSLKACRNRFDEPFRAGGFFATKEPHHVVMVQIEPETNTNDASELIGLQVVQGAPELR